MKESENLHKMPVFFYVKSFRTINVDRRST
jgi:hypothetical protein